MEELERSLEGFKAFLRLARHEEDGQATIRKQAEELEPSPRLNATSASIKSVEEQVLDRKGSNPSEQGMEPNLDPEVNRTQTKRDPNLISDLCHQSSETGPPPSLPSNGFPEADIGHRARWNPRKESIQRDLQPRKNPSRSFRDEGSVDPDPRLLETAVRSRSQDGSGEGVEGIPPFTLAEDPASNPLLLLLPTKRGGESSGTRSEEGNGSTNVGLQPEPQIRVEEVWKRSGDSVRNSNPASSSLSILRNPPPTSQVEEGGGGGVVPSERSRGEKIGPPKRGGGKRGGLKVRNRCLVTTSSKTLNELLESFGLIGQVQDDQDQYQETSTTVRLMTDGRVVKEGNSHKPQIFEKEEGEENQPVSEEGPSPPPPPPPPPLHPSSPSADRSDQVPSRKNEKLVEMTTTVGIEGDLLQARVCSSQQTFLQPEEEEEEEEEGGGFLSRKPSSLQLGIDQDGSEDHPRLEEVVEEEFQGNEVGVEEERGSDSNRIGNQGRDQEEYDDDDDDEDSPPIPGYPSINMPATTFLPDHGTTSLDHHHFLPRHHHRNQHPFSSSPTTCRGGGGGGGLLNPEEVVVILASSLEPHPHRPTVDVVIDRKRSSSPVIEAEVGDESMLASRGGERGSFGSDSSENRDWKRMRI
ncbi:hypothetical protein IE53DRAFT_387339 [Violaceomyces palustris]|uniref:Uncharacterized protein n=1 Tax=Violaceomyces palustris TaxID=1673888 RepID=A0ACD0NX68_9BASI|nr:hypothetical protein IE53DRAFT_387339 [Violaceomyces palustris]